MMNINGNISGPSNLKQNYGKIHIKTFEDYKEPCKYKALVLRVKALQNNVISTKLSIL